MINPRKSRPPKQTSTSIGQRLTRLKNLKIQHKPIEQPVKVQRKKVILAAWIPATLPTKADGI